MFKVPVFSCLLTGGGFSYRDRRWIKNKTTSHLPTLLQQVIMQTTNLIKSSGNHASNTSIPQTQRVNLQILFSMEAFHVCITALEEFWDFLPLMGSCLAFSWSMMPAEVVGTIKPKRQHGSSFFCHFLDHFSRSLGCTSNLGLIIPLLLKRMVIAVFAAL